MEVKERICMIKNGKHLGYGEHCTAEFKIKDMKTAGILTFKAEDKVYQDLKTIFECKTEKIVEIGLNYQIIKVKIKELKKRDGFIIIHF